MARATKADIRAVESAINHALERWNSDKRVFVQWAYGQPRAYWQPVGKTTVTNLSPRLPTGAMLQWLEAFYRGMETGSRLAHDEVEKR